MFQAGKSISRLETLKWQVALSKLPVLRLSTHFIKTSKKIGCSPTTYRRRQRVRRGRVRLLLHLLEMIAHGRSRRSCGGGRRRHDARSGRRLDSRRVGRHRFEQRRSRRGRGSGRALRCWQTNSGIGRGCGCRRCDRQRRWQQLHLGRWNLRKKRILEETKGLMPTFFITIF